MNDENLRVACEVIEPLVRELGARLDVDPDADDRLAVRVLTDFALRIWAAALHAGSVEALARAIEQGAIDPGVNVHIEPLDLPPVETLGELAALEDLDGED